MGDSEKNAVFVGTCSNCGNVHVGITDEHGDLAGVVALPADAADDLADRLRKHADQARAFGRLSPAGRA